MSKAKNMDVGEYKGESEVLVGYSFQHFRPNPHLHRDIDILVHQAYREIEKIVKLKLYRYIVSNICDNLHNFQDGCFY